MQECFGDWDPAEAMELIYTCLGYGCLNMTTKRGLMKDTAELCQKVTESAAKGKKGASKAKSSSKGVTKSKATAKGAATKKIASAVDVDDREWDDDVIPASRCIGK
jgi:hypothetical protein